MTGKIDPLFANHLEVLAMEAQSKKFMDSIRIGATESDLLDALLLKENEISRLLTAMLRIQSVLRPIDNADNVETVGRAIEIAASAACRKSFK